MQAWHKHYPWNVSGFFMLVYTSMYKVHPALAPGAFAAGILYEAFLRARNGLYAQGLLHQHRLAKPVISIGNLTMGGSGKTPLVIHVARILAELGFVPAILSRGYGRDKSGQEHIVPPGEKIPAAETTLGDEPALIRRHLPFVWMGISKNRCRTGAVLSRQPMRAVFLLDDGFQHRRLHRDLDIVIIDTSQPLASNRVFPRGTLREPLSELRRCHMVVLNGEPESAHTVECEVRKIHPLARIHHCRQTIRALVPFASWRLGQEPAEHSGGALSAFLAAALGNPERFRRDVLQLGIDVRGVRFFRDHYPIRPKDWLECAADARSKRADALIITEKDAVKIWHPPDFPLLVAVQETGLTDGQGFQGVLRDCLRECE